VPAFGIGDGEFKIALPMLELLALYGILLYLAA
jgi:hypothetical protein